MVCNMREHTRQSITSSDHFDTGTKRFKCPDGHFCVLKNGSANPLDDTFPYYAVCLFPCYYKHRRSYRYRKKKFLACRHIDTNKYYNDTQVSAVTSKSQSSLNFHQYVSVSCSVLTQNRCTTNSLSRYKPILSFFYSDSFSSRR